MGNYVVLLGTAFLREHTLVKPVVQARKLARLFRGYQVDALHTGGQMFRVTQIPSQAKEVAGKFQDESLHFLAGIATNFFGKLLDDLKRQFLCRRSEEHTSELQSHLNLVCRLLLEKKKERNTELDSF